MRAFSSPAADETAKPEDTTYRHGAGMASGFPSPADDFMDGMLNLHRLVVKRPSSTLLIWAGADCTPGPGVRDGDLLVADCAIAPFEGCTVVCQVDGEVLAATYKGKGRQASLHLSCRAPIELAAHEDVRLLGVVTWRLRRPGADCAKNCHTKP